MIPVIIEDDGGVVTINESVYVDFYDYSNKQWANAILVSEDVREYYSLEDLQVDESDILAYFVWIPRFAYRLWSNMMTATSSEELIDIMFQGSDEERYISNTVEDYVTHPAFIYGIMIWIVFG